MTVLPPGPWEVRPAATPVTAREAAAARAEGPAEPSAVTQYPCGSCGATVAYAPGATHLSCPWCGAETPIPAADATDAAEALRERDYAAALRETGGEVEMETTRVARCDACGAATEFEPGVHAAVCPFCATPLVADPSEDRHIRPQGLLPFAIPADEARARVGRWRRGLWFAPSGLGRFARDEGRLAGVYTPYWTFDAGTETAYAGERGDAETIRVMGPDGKPRMATRIRWTPVAGRTARAFDDVLVLGATSLPEDHAEALAPWDLSDLRPYARDWLAGFRAEAYTVGVEQGFARAREVMDAQIRMDVRRAIGGDQQRLARVDSRVWGVTFKHVLLPVWVGAYRWRGRVYRIVVNGRTGAVRGERPWSWLKIGLAILAALALAAAAFWVAEAGGGGATYDLRAPGGMVFPQGGWR
jgi:LSD1 subclass zinc finger protein